MSGKPGRSGPPGNPHALKSGLYSRDESRRLMRDRRVQRMARRLQSLWPWVTDSDLPALRLLAERLVRHGDIAKLMRREGMTFSDGEDTGLRKYVSELRQLEDSIGKDFQRFGGTPESRAALKLTVSRAQTLDEYIAAKYGDRAVEAAPEMSALPAPAEASPANGTAVDAPLLAVDCQPVAAPVLASCGPLAADRANLADTAPAESISDVPIPVEAEPSYARTTEGTAPVDHAGVDHLDGEEASGRLALALRLSAARRPRLWGRP